MIPLGYMARKIAKKDDWLKAPPHVEEICSANCCGYLSKCFCDCIKHWKHNGWWFFDSPDVIRAVAEAEETDLGDTRLHYYEAFEKQYDDAECEWKFFEPEPSFATNVKLPEDADKRFLGFDIVTFSLQTSPECSPLSCNGLANEIPTNKHCLLDDLDEAKRLLESGEFHSDEPGPFRIIAVYEVKNGANR